MCYQIEKTTAAVIVNAICIICNYNYNSEQNYVCLMCKKYHPDKGNVCLNCKKQKCKRCDNDVDDENTCTVCHYHRYKTNHTCDKCQKYHTGEYQSKCDKCRDHKCDICDVFIESVQYGHRCFECNQRRKKYNCKSCRKSIPTTKFAGKCFDCNNK